MRDLLSPEAQKQHPHTVYDLIANIVHDGEPNTKGTYRAHVLHKGSGLWYELQDLRVIDILPQMITLSEAYIQIWEQRDETVSDDSVKKETMNESEAKKD